jgi:hypothetical protein
LQLLQSCDKPNLPFDSQGFKANPGLQLANTLGVSDQVFRKPTLPRPYDALGGALESAKDEKGAEEVFRQGMAADPKHMGGRFTLGRMLVKQGRLSVVVQFGNEVSTVTR